MSGTLVLRNRKRLVARKVLPIRPNSGHLTNDDDHLMSVKEMREFKKKHNRIAEQHAARDQADGTPDKLATRSTAGRHCSFASLVATISARDEAEQGPEQS